MFFLVSFFKLTSGFRLLAIVQLQGSCYASAKNGNLQDIKNWHPVSLLYLDYIILSKALANRLREAMEQALHQDQIYNVPGRSMEDNIDLI